MTIELTWKPSFACSCIHAAEALCRGAKFADSALAEAIEAPARGLQQLLVDTQLPPERIWNHLAALSGGIDSNRQLAELALRKTIGSGARADVAAPRLAACIAELENAALSKFGALVDELELRGGPLRQQWEARGPGLLKRFADLTDPRLLVERADVLLVRPALGGGGAAHLAYNSVRIEAVLANPIAELPETARLAWLLAQLNNDLPMFGERVHGDRLPVISSLAMLPPLLSAAQHVELARYDHATLQHTLDAWRIATPDKLDTVDILQRWWETYLDSRPSWDIALAALDQMAT